MRFFKTVVLGAIILAMSTLVLATMFNVTVALAQIIAPDPNAVSGTSIFGVFRPYLVDILGVVVTAIGVWAVALFQRWTGIQIEAAHRDTLQTTLKNAAALLVESVDKQVANINFRTQDPKVAEAIKYVTTGAPDALKYFDLSPAQVAEKLRAFVPQVEAVVQPVVVEAPLTPPPPQAQRRL